MNDVVGQGITTLPDLFLLLAPDYFHEIDFKIGDIYLQIDGRYLHGLDRPLEEIKQSSAGRDKSIYQRWFSDRDQDEQFSAAGLRLLRITDKGRKNG